MPQTVSLRRCLKPVPQRCLFDSHSASSIPSPWRRHRTRSRIAARARPFRFTMDLCLATSRYAIGSRGISHPLARVAKLADAADLKSADLYRSWGFKSPSGHQMLKELSQNSHLDLRWLFLSGGCSDGCWFQPSCATIQGHQLCHLKVDSKRAGRKPVDAEC
jgi:hypothetical protein